MEDKEQAFNKLIDEALPMLRSAANGILNNNSDADDAVQIALVKVWKYLDKFTTNAKLSTWAYTVTVNTAKDIYRKKRREQNKLDSYDHENNSANEDYEAMLENLRCAVADLPADLCVVMSAIYYNGFSVEETAKLLDCTVSSVYQRVHKAKTILRKKFGAK
jgi:RNA polymerase sigma-70 factor (ECF subfamily)